VHDRRYWHSGGGEPRIRACSDGAGARRHVIKCFGELRGLAIVADVHTVSVNVNSFEQSEFGATRRVILPC
jgi:hypothetical protein